MKVSIYWKLVVAMAASAALTPPAALLRAEPDAAGVTPIQVEAADPQPTPAPFPASGARVRISDESPEPAPAEAASTEPEVELVTQRYPNGKVKLEKEMIQDADGNYIAHGAWRSYDEAGRLVLVGTYRQGQRHGVWKRQLRANESPLFSTEPYKAFDGPFVTAVSYENGQLHGVWTISDARDRKVHEIRFASGDRDGDAVWYFPGGSLFSKASYQRGVVVGEVVRFAATGAVIAREQYAEGRNQAPRLEYYDGNRKKSEVTVLHAPLAVKTPDDPLAAVLAVFEQRGREERNGPFRMWYANGQLAREGEYRYNLPVGKASWWYASGQKQMEGTYVDGKQEGRWTWWHENGLKSISGDYKDGVPSGAWTWWKDTGRVAQKADMSTDARRITRVPTPPPDTDSGLELVAPQTLDR